MTYFKLRLKAMKTTQLDDVREGEHVESLSSELALMTER